MITWADTLHIVGLFAGLSMLIVYIDPNKRKSTNSIKIDYIYEF